MNREHNPGICALVRLVPGNLLWNMPVGGLSDMDVAGLSSDSRTVRPGDLFVALAGGEVSGYDFAAEAVSRGAVAVVSNDPKAARASLHVPVAYDPDLASGLSHLAGRFYGHPSRHLDVTGITGTNGKTSCCYWLSWMLNELGIPAGQVGTLGAGMWRHTKATLDITGLTTPDAIQVQHLLAEYRGAGAEAMVMEVSSHGLDQGRVGDIRFATAVCTNLSQDHQDYHSDMDAYLQAKLSLFRYPGLKRVVVNLDDPASEAFLKAVRSPVKAYRHSRLDATADLVLQTVSEDVSGFRVVLSGVWGEAQLHIPVVGEYNLSNLMAVATVLLARGEDFTRVVDLLGRVPPVPGRMEVIDLAGRPQVVVDFAHTPDAVASALRALRQRTAGRLICVLGCGGNRDRSKRPLMAEAAIHHSDAQIFTADNPRDESVEGILHEMTASLDRDELASVDLIEDRRTAVQSAVAMAEEEDLVAVLGRGHETHQHIGVRRIPLSDRQLCEQAIAMRQAG